MRGGVAERLRRMTLPAAGRAEKQDIGVLGDEARGGELEDQGVVHGDAHQRASLPRSSAQCTTKSGAAAVDKATEQR